MDLTVREAATLLGCSARSVRARLVRGSLPGQKKGSTWTIPRDRLPLTELQRRKLQRKADAVRRAVEDVLPPFPSIDLGILRRLLARRLRDREFLGVVDRILEGAAGMYDREPVRSEARLAPDWPPPGRGLPIGSATSQLFAAQVYLAELDHFVKRRLCVPGYVRYLDDLFLFGQRRRDLLAWRAEIAEWLDGKRGLLLKRPAAPVRSCHGTLDALGYRLRREGLISRPRAYRQLQRRVVGALGSSPGKTGSVDLARSLAASAGVLLF